jgi:hypothetical protein
MLIGSPLSAKRAIARNGSKEWLGFAFFGGAKGESAGLTSATMACD